MSEKVSWRIIRFLLPLVTDYKSIKLNKNEKRPETKTFNITYEREMGDWYLQATYLNSKQEEANYKILDTGTPLVGDMPTKPTLTAPDGRPIYNQSESQFKTTKFGLYNVGGAQREVVSFSLSKLFNSHTIYKSFVQIIF